jgi:selenide,water dikinase
MARASNVRLVINSSGVPFMEKVLELIEAGVVPGGTRHNAEAHAAFTDFDESVPEAVRIGLSDAQTSGGLLISLDADAAADLVRDLRARNVPVAIIGEVRNGAGLEVRA